MKIRPTHAWLPTAGLVLLGLLAGGWSLGCAADLGGFVSDDPNGPRDDSHNGSAQDDGATSTEDPGYGGSGAGEGGAGASEAGQAEEDPERVIAEADIIQIDGGRLYALSEYSGLSIIDVSVSDQLTLLGRLALPGVPFEMYLRDGVAYAMFSSWGRYEEGPEGWQWVQSSRLAAFDVTTPSAITAIGSFEIPGSLADSRMVGDVIYVVSYEDGYCWDCGPSANTSVTSIRVADPTRPQLVDRLSFEEDGYGSWRRSISVTDERMYVAGIDWGDGSGSSTTVQVVDIADPSGVLALGTSVQVAGQIQSRWQMDERDGVLRVISQPWNASVFPQVQTFTVTSSEQVTPLGQTELVLPQPEQLRAVRFDATRAYAITAEVEVGDPLYTVDLSDPASPQQMAALEMPGWVYHIEPRGNQLLALGFDPDNAEGGLNVSLFDVTDLSAPTLVRRIAFGGDWGNFAEDQDRIHKAFKILPELGLVLVPFTAWDWDDWGCSSYQSGIQLIDWTGPELVKRGVAPIRGEARRAFVHEGRLFAMSEEQVRVFAIDDRDGPAKTAELPLSTHVSQTLVHGDELIRLAADWWTSEPRLEIVSAANPTSDMPLGAVDLGATLAAVEQDQSCYGWSYWSVRMFAHGDAVYLVWPSWNGTVARVASIDISDPTAPRVGGWLDLPVDVYSYGGYYWGYSPLLIASGEPIVQLGSTLAMLSIDVPRDEWGYPSYEVGWGLVHEASVRLVDLSNVDAPRLGATVQLPLGGGHTGLVADADQVLSSHWFPVEGEEGKVRFYLDRLNVMSPDAALLLPPVNVPGSLVAFDGPSQNVLTVDYELQTLSDVAQGDCYAAFGYGVFFRPYNDNWWETGYWEDALGDCSVMHRRLRLSHVAAQSMVAELLSEFPLPQAAYYSRLLVGDDRVFTTYNPYYVNYDQEQPSSELWAVGGLRDGQLVVRSRSLEDIWWTSPLEARGKTLVAMSWPGSIVTVDATDLDELAVREHGELPWSVYSAEIDGDRALLSLGPYGLHVADVQ